MKIVNSKCGLNFNSGYQLRANYSHDDLRLEYGLFRAQLMAQIQKLRPDWANKQKQRWDVGKIIYIFTSMEDYFKPNDWTLIANWQL